MNTGLTRTARLTSSIGKDDATAPLCESSLVPRPHPESDSRFDYDHVKRSTLASTPNEIDRPTEMRRSAGLALHESPAVTIVEGNVRHHLWRISPVKQPEGRGTLYDSRWSGHSNGAMTYSQRKIYLNSNYYQAAGEVGIPRDPHYQFSVMLGLRDDSFRHASRLDVKVTPTEVCLLQHVTLEFDQDLPPEQQRAFTTRVAQAVREILDNKLDIVELRDGHPIRRRLRLEVAFLDPVSDANEHDRGESVVKVHSGSGRANSVTLYASSSKGVIAHEMAHRLLAAEDEYSDEESRRNNSGAGTGPVRASVTRSEKM